MENEAEGGPVFRWNVDPEQINLDLWAHLHVSLAVEDGKRNRSGVARYGPWPIIVLIAIGVGLVVSMYQWLLFLFYVAVIFGARKIWYRRSTTALARKLHNIPSLANGYTFFAAQGGTHREGQGSTQQYEWSRWKSAWVHGHLVVLRLDVGGIELLPVAALTSGQTADDAVATISGWITASRPPVPQLGEYRTGQ